MMAMIMLSVLHINFTHDVEACRCLNKEDRLLKSQKVNKLKCERKALKVDRTPFFKIPSCSSKSKIAAKYEAESYDRH